MGKRADTEPLLIRVSDDELRLLNNALNEVVNGVEIGEPEFGTRLGASRPEARRLLDRINGILTERRQAEPSAAADPAGT